MDKELLKIWALLESARNENNKEIIDILQSNLDKYDKKGDVDN